MSYTCPRCGITSHNPNDEAERYCDRCHAWPEHDTWMFGVVVPGIRGREPYIAACRLCHWTAEPAPAAWWAGQALAKHLAEPTHVAAVSLLTYTMGGDRALERP